MAKKSLRASMNQIRTWVRQGRTDAWIAHQLEVPTTQLSDFKRQHGLEAGGEEEPSDIELRDEIEAEVEAASAAEPEEPEPEPEQEAKEEPGEKPEEGRERQEDTDKAEKAPEPAAEKEPDKREEGDGRPRRRRRRRRGRGGRRTLEAVFDHGERDGYGLWLDPAVKDDPVYSEHWSGKRELKVSIEPDRIVLERAEGGNGKGNDGKGGGKGG